MAGAWAAALSGAPSTLHALATGRDPLEATKAAGSILLPDERRTLPLVAAALPVHLALAYVAYRIGKREQGAGTSRPGRAAAALG